MNKAIIVNKEAGYTSRDVVNKLNYILKTKKIGHAGTLDPLATGVLVCLTGKYTKLLSVITNEEKEYIAEIKLGIKTDTLDITGTIIEKKDIGKLDIENIKKVLKSFIGEYKETVPLYSAVHINGKRLYEYAREGKKVDLPVRKVLIKDIELLKYEKDIIKFKVLVSKGTYIRSLIDSICEKLNVIGTMYSLVRTKQGLFKIEDASTLDDIERGKYKSFSLEELIKVTVIELDSSLETKVLNGNKIEMNKDGLILFVKNNMEIALYYFENNIGRLKILF